VVWSYILTFPMGFLEGGYPAWVAKERMLAECLVGRISFFGNSRVEAGIVPAVMPVDVSNFGVAAGTPIEVYAAVRRAMRCEHPPNYAVISLAPNDFGPLTQFFWINSLRYGFVDRSLLAEIQQTAREIGDAVTLRHAKTAEGLSGPVRDWLYAAHFPSLYFSSLAKGQLFRRYESNRRQLARVLEDRGFVSYEVTAQPVAPQRPEARGPADGIPMPLHAVYFERTLRLLADHGVEVGLLLTPTRESTTFGGAEAAFGDYLKRTADRFPNVRLINRESPRWPSSLFADGQHLNAVGAKQFSARLAGCMAGASVRAGCDLAWRPEELPAASLAGRAGPRPSRQVAP
jgi:hypothetical protein